MQRDVTRLPDDIAAENLREPILASRLKRANVGKGDEHESARRQQPRDLAQKLARMLRVLQDVGKAVGRPDLRPFDLSQQVAAGHVVIVVMRGDDDLDRADAEVPFHGVDRVQPRAP